jgi:hypothetical protein
MILFFNTMLTSDIPWLNYDRGHLTTPNKVDVFKYTIASMAALPLEKAIIYVELEDQHKEREAEVRDFVQEQFAGVELSYYTKRNCTQPQWKEAIQEVAHLPGGYPIWYMGNHDHPFIDYDLEMVNLCIDAFQQEPKLLKSCIYSHWSEFITETLKYGHSLEYPGVISYKARNTHSIQIISKELLFSWWYGGNYRDTFLPRSDWWYSNPLNGGQPILKSPEYKCFVPMRELCRHFDGYHHIGVSPQSACPPLDIPDGFFTGDIKLQYSPSKLQGTTTIWPESKVMYAGDGVGPDLIGVMEDIPLFWRSRIRNPFPSPPTSHHPRNLFYRSLMNLVPNMKGLQVPDSWTYYIDRLER